MPHRAQMLKGGVIMDVVNPEQARIAEEAGAVAVMALERVPADIRADGGVARMSDPSMIKAIMESVTIPVMAKCRIGHFVEAQIIEAVGVDYIDESEVLTPADEELHINKHKFKVPFVCGCRNLGEALRRIDEGASMIRTKGEAGTGNVVEAVRHARCVHREVKQLLSMDEDELFMFGAQPATSAATALPHSRPTAPPPGAGSEAAHSPCACTPAPACAHCVVCHSQADRCILRLGQEDTGDGALAGRKFCRRRGGHTRRRGAHDAARCRRRLRGLRYLQER
jgi:hypothetical protein